MLKQILISGSLLLFSIPSLAATGNVRLSGSCTVSASPNEPQIINFELDTVSNPTFRIPADLQIGSLDSLVTLKEYRQEGQRHIAAEIEISTREPWGHLKRIAHDVAVDPEVGIQLQATGGYGPNISCIATVNEVSTTFYDREESIDLKINTRRLRAGVPMPTFNTCGLRLHFPEREKSLSTLLSQLDISARDHLNLIIVPYEARDELLIYIDQKSWHEYVFIETLNRSTLNEVITTTLYPNRQENLGTLQLLSCPTSRFN